MTQDSCRWSEWSRCPVAWLGVRTAVDPDLGAGDERAVVGGHHGDHRRHRTRVTEDLAGRAVQQRSLLGPQAEVVAFGHLVQGAVGQRGRRPRPVEC